MAGTNNPHDSFFKRLFGDLAVATDFLQNYLSSEILSHLDLATLRLEKESFIDPNLRNHFSDLLFSLKLRTGADVFIFLLLEHKSAPDTWVAFQLLRYIVQLWERQRAKGHEKLPMILPIVFYHGQEPWTAPRQLSTLIETAGIAELRKYGPELVYDLRDLSPTSGEEIKGQAKLRTGLQLLRNIFNPDLSQLLPEVFRNLREMNRSDALEYARSLLAYLSGTRKKIRKEEMKMAIQEAFGTLEFDKSALFIQEWMAEGREEGREEGIQIGEHKALSTLTLRLIRRLIGEIPEDTRDEILALPNQRLEELGEDLLDVTSLEELHQWLHNHATKH